MPQKVQANHGGVRKGAGRPLSEPSTRIRVPLGCVDRVKYEICCYRSHQSPFPPLFSNRIAAGTASPAEEEVEARLDLNQYLLNHPADSFYLRVEGDSMLGAGIHHGDLLIVDRSLEAQHGKVVIAVIDGELTVKRLKVDSEHDQITLQPENPEYSPIEVTDNHEISILGVVIHVIHSL